MKPAELYDFMKRYKYCVQSSVSADGAPQAAVVATLVLPELELFFDTVTTSRKYQNLKHDPRIAFVIGWEHLVTVQYEGVAEELTGRELAPYKKLYLSRFPDGLERERDPNNTYFRVRPKWIRYSDFNTFAPTIIEFTEGELVR